MNFGRFFKLNQNLSSTVNGLTIFDYTELPAYEGLDSNNPMSPKFPISISITDNAVRFKMHYCVYRCSNDLRQATQQEDKEFYPYYGFSIEDIRRNLYKNHPKETYEHDLINVVHIEEIILELPFSGFKAKSLTEIIKKSYIASFPQLREGEEKNNKEMTGNLFLDKLIEKSFFYHDINSDAVSYSTLWLMDLYDNDGQLCLRREKDGLIDKFLRKLFLDFLFDLKHSTVFQTSMNYDRMYSGLMSNYYFSTLMHKCEFYYYRDLITRQVELFTNDTKDGFTYLYAMELFEAQELWTDDIINPLSESNFEHDFPNFRDRLSSIFYEKLSGKKWNSWFATPEEEMRRVYFTMNERNIARNCNAESVSEFLNLNKRTDDVIRESLVSIREKREKVSQWFISRYDFNDVFHFHFFKLFNLGFTLAAIIFIVQLFFFRQYLEGVMHDAVSSIMNYSSLRSLIILTLTLSVSPSLSRLYFSKKMKQANKGEDLLRFAHHQFYSTKLQGTVIGFCILAWALIIICFLTDIFTGNLLFSTLDEPSQKSLCWSIVLICVLLCLLEPSLYEKPLLFIKRRQIQKIIRNMHIIYPRLFASIIAAWLTLSTGHVIYSSFFDVKVTWSVPITITVIVVSFIISRISRIMPTTSSLLVSARAFELFIISYFMAFIIGIFVISSVGEKYIFKYSILNKEFEQKNLARTMNLSQSEDSITPKNNTDSANITEANNYIINSTDSVILLETNRDIYRIVKGQKTIKFYLSPNIKSNKYTRLIAVKYKIPNTNFYLFIMPDFLIMFSFLTMFIGIFLQMAFYDTKRLTDF